jgi:hypothetical protein
LSQNINQDIHYFQLERNKVLSGWNLAQGLFYVLYFVDSGKPACDNKNYCECLQLNPQNRAEDYMKRLFIFAILCILLVLATDLFAQSSGNVRGYMRNNGTYVQPYHRTVPDGNPWNNYSTQGNTNPYTGRSGTVSPYSVPSPSPYNSPNNFNNNYNPYGPKQTKPRW